MKRRSNGEGSYGKRIINGIQYFTYRTPGVQKTIYARTMKELNQKRKALETKPAVPKGKEITVSDLCKLWLASSRGGIAPSTYDSYEDIVQVRIENYKTYDIANKQVCNLIPEMLDAYLDSLKEKYTKGSLDKTWVVLKQALQYGQDKGYLAKDFRLDKIQKPKEREIIKKKKEIQFTTLNDVELLYQEAYRLNRRDTPVYGDGAKVLVFIMYSGVRIGEAIGLTWKYVSKDYSEVRIQHSNRRVVKRDDTGSAIIEDNHRVYEPLQKETKTESGERTIPLPERAIEVLNHFAKAFPNHKPDDHVFLTSSGNLYDRKNLERTLQRMMNNSSCSNKEYTPHSLRHGYGSILISQGVDIKTVSVLLGHKDISTTYNTYIHVLEEDKRKAVINVFDKHK